MDDTKIVNVEGFNREYVSQTVKEIADILEEKGYNPINQIVGYLISGDPGYISNHKEARNKITELDRTKIIEMLLKEFLNKWDI